MSSPFTQPHDMPSPRPMLAPPALESGDDSDSDLPHRMMRVKVLYTFDDGNKTNCLARLPNALNIPVLQLDESTQIGVVELAVCTQAIVASSPELIAKLQHDYTVYAYDYSEYETPLVGQGMLSWVLATASPTPSAPASQSKTMITGRVCKNILGLFSANGIKETLEVKLKLVPVPSCSKDDFLRNMATYRNPSVTMPEGFDSNAWNSFLQAIPNAGSVDDASQIFNAQSNRSVMGGVEQLHDMLTPNFGQEEDNFTARRSMPGSREGSRTGSPTPSHLSANAQQVVGYNQSRPASRMSIPQQNDSDYGDHNYDQTYEEGPLRKRARPMQIDWNGRGSFGANADSLRVAVSTSASLRGFRPSLIASTSAGSDMLPRAPTPRPGEKTIGHANRPAVASNLRSESFSAQYHSPYPPSDPGYPQVDSGIYSLGDDEASETFGSLSPDIPSSPPEYRPVDVSVPPSSPGLPELPHGADSGFQSDAVMEAPRAKKCPQRMANKHLVRQRQGVFEFREVQPGQKDNLPRTGFPNFDPLSHKAALASIVGAAPSSPTVKVNNHRRGGRAQSRTTELSASHVQQKLAQPNVVSPEYVDVLPSTEEQSSVRPPSSNIEQVDGGQPFGCPSSLAPSCVPPEHEIASLAPSQFPAHQLPPLAPQSAIQPAPACSTSQGPLATGVVLPPKAKPDSKQGQSRNRGRNAPVLARSQTWNVAGSSDVESDSAFNGSTTGRKARSKSYLVRTQSIKDQLHQDVANGDPVKHCRNCGDINTPTWRPYWTRDFEGNGTDISITAKSGIHMIESLAKDANFVTTRFKIYKQYSHLSPLEKDENLFDQYIFCNPCGDWIRKYSEHRPATCWLNDPNAPPVKKRRTRKKKGDIASDFPIPSSEWDLQACSTNPNFPGPPHFTEPHSSLGGTIQPPAVSQNEELLESGIHQPESVSILTPTSNQQNVPEHADVQETCNETTATSAIQQANQSSPAKVIDHYIGQVENVDAISPKPTRRILFPSPRKSGEFKSLDNVGSATSNTASTTASPNTGPVAISIPPTPAAQIEFDVEQVNKENLPPPTDSNDEFAHLFDDTILFGTPGKLTPKTARSIAHLLKTPTSRERSLGDRLSTPQTGSKRSGDYLVSPTRSHKSRLSPNNIGSANRQKPMTPFTASLNLFFSDGITDSPSKAFPWALTSSPARGDHNGIFDETFAGDDAFSLDIPPIPSSPPLMSTSLHDDSGAYVDLGFEMFEDATATAGLADWDDRFFDGDGSSEDEVDGMIGPTDGGDLNLGTQKRKWSELDVGVDVSTTEPGASTTGSVECATILDTTGGACVDLHAPTATIAAGAN